MSYYNSLFVFSGITYVENTSIWLCFTASAQNAPKRAGLVAWSL